MFIRNLWYMAAWEHEISADGLFSRTIIGIPLVFYRDDAGRVVALDERSNSQSSYHSRTVWSPRTTLLVATSTS